MSDKKELKHVKQNLITLAQSLWAVVLGIIGGIALAALLQWIFHSKQGISPDFKEVKGDN